MKTITQMRDEIKDVQTKLGAMKADCERAGRDPSDSEIADAKVMLSRVAKLQSMIALELDIQAANQALDEPQERRNPALDPDGQRRIPDGQENRDRFSSFGEFLVAVVDACSPDRRTDPRLTTRATGLGEGVPSDGGFLVQQDFSQELFKRAYDTSVVASRCRRVPIGAGKNGLKINAVAETSRANGSRWGGVQAYWLAEAGTKTASKPKFRQIELSLEKLIGLCYATDELLQDAQALESIIMEAFAEEIGFKLDDSVIRGDGVGKPLGILNSNCLVTQAAEGAQTNTTIVHNNVIKMWSRLWAKSRSEAVWLINQDCEPELNNMFMATANWPVYLPAGGISQAPYGSLLGRPVLPVEQCSTLGAVGDIILANFKEYILIDKGGLQSDQSIHVRFVYDETAFRFIYRVDGQPLWDSALTPYQGTNTLSPFVTLAGRP